jgi:hypothetical protein
MARCAGGALERVCGEDERGVVRPIERAPRLRRNEICLDRRTVVGESVNGDGAVRGKLVAAPELIITLGGMGGSGPGRPRARTAAAVGGRKSCRPARRI